MEFEGKTAKDVRKRMDEVMEERGEGLILKHVDSQYTLNGRNKDWVKVKPEYTVRQLLSFATVTYSSLCRTTWEKLLTCLLLVRHPY
jgi:ATP-dependent DNA ligase